MQIAASPDGILHELNPGNDVALRRVVVAGPPGARTVTVPPVGMVSG